MNLRFWEWLFRRGNNWSEPIRPGRQKKKRYRAKNLIYLKYDSNGYAIEVTEKEPNDVVLILKFGSWAYFENYKHTSFGIGEERRSSICEPDWQKREDLIIGVYDKTNIYHLQRMGIAIENASRHIWQSGVGQAVYQRAYYETGFGYIAPETF